jgi:hypothetical protein
MFNIIYYIGKVLVTECPAAVRQVLIANTDQVLGFCTEKNTVKEK